MKIAVTALIFCLFALRALAQEPVPPPDLKSFLGLSDSQYSMLVQINATYYSFFSGKQQRISQVQQELDVETAKVTLDPAALGVRYLEIETICRQLQTEALTMPRKARAVLNDAQSAKLKALEDALQLQPLVRQAQGLNILDGPNFPGTFYLLPAPPPGDPFKIGFIAVGDFSNNIYGCRARPSQPQPTN